MHETYLTSLPTFDRIPKWFVNVAAKAARPLTAIWRQARSFCFEPHEAFVTPTRTLLVAQERSGVRTVRQARLLAGRVVLPLNTRRRMVGEAQLNALTLTYKSDLVMAASKPAAAETEEMAPVIGGEAIDLDFSAAMAFGLEEVVEEPPRRIQILQPAIVQAQFAVFTERIMAKRQRVRVLGTRPNRFTFDVSRAFHELGVPIGFEDYVRFLESGQQLRIGRDEPTIMEFAPFMKLLRREVQRDPEDGLILPNFGELEAEFRQQLQSGDAEALSRFLKTNKSKATSKPPALMASL